MRNKILHGDCVELLTDFEENSVDIVVTSPPYDKLRNYKGYTLDLPELGKQCYRVLKDGSICAVIIQDQTKNFAKSLSSFKLVLDWCGDVGFRLFETCIYKKQGVEGAWWKKRFRVDHEYIFLFLKGPKPLYFNKEPLKIPSKHGGKIMTGAAVRLKDGSNLPSRKVKINKLKCRGTIWDYTTCGDGGKLKHQHPATFPNMLPYDLIECFCPPEGIVLDPLNGSGTTCVAAKSLGRKYIGIDISEEYCEIARKRLALEFITREGIKDDQIYLFGLDE
jgi:site-specific DNA-methyltransferase (adenine-specific)